MRFKYLFILICSGLIVSNINTMKRKRSDVIKRKAKRRKIKKPLTKEQIQDRVSYYCTSLIQLTSCEILKNYKKLLKKDWNIGLNFEVQEHVIRAMLCKNMLSSKKPKRCKYFLALIRNYKQRNFDLKKDIFLVEQYVDKLCIVNKIKKEIGLKKYANGPSFVHLKKNLKDISEVVRLDDKNVQVILGSFVYLFDPTCKQLLYADGHENEAVTCSKYVIIGNRKRLFIGYSDGHVLFIPVGKTVLSGDVNGPVKDISVYQKDKEVVRVAILYGTDLGQKVTFSRAFEKQEDQWFLHSDLHALPQQVESMEFDEDQLITQSSDLQQVWDFVPNLEGDLQVKNTHTLFMS